MIEALYYQLQAYAQSNPMELMAWVIAGVIVSGWFVVVRR
jgi:hypothetical protein